MPFEAIGLDINGVIVVQPKVFEDERGYFFESYKRSDFVKFGIDADFCQDNQSRSCRGVLRGLHYQLNPAAQAKLVRCLEGEIFDVAVDIRKNSPTFGKWVSQVLSADNKKMLYLPEGFAHGFLTLSDHAVISYKVNSEYCAACDRGIRWNDSDIAVEWPFKDGLIISSKDEKQPYLKDAEVF